MSAADPAVNGRTSASSDPPADPPATPGAVVEVRDLAVRFGDIRAVDGVSLDIPRGTIYGLLGPNGAGKTTLIRVLATLLRPDAGTARVAGVDVVAEPTRARAHLGLAGQFAAVDEYQTGRENVRMVGRLYGLRPAEARRRTDEVLERIDLIDAADRRVGTYSGGMRRRLDLAASLVGRPEVVFLDEPTTGIDPRSRQELWQLVRGLVDAGTTVLLTTQYLEEADQLADRIGVIDHGRIIREGTSDELKDKLGSAMIDVGIELHERDQVVALLSGIGEDDAVWDEAMARVRLPARHGARTLTAVTRTLDEAGVEALDIAIHRPTLDDVFLALTGDTTADRDPADPDRTHADPDRTHADPDPTRADPANAGPDDQGRGGRRARRSRKARR